jgi:peptidoglycan/xylan/chitin deacetylase (PgdA/CDA1 family)
MSRVRVAVLTTGLLILLFGALAASFRLAGSRTFQLFGGLIAQVPTRDSVIALTFDDGPAPGVADTILAVLRARGVRATFFVTGRSLASAPAVAARFIEAGQELGNHSYSHRHMLFMSPQLIREEVERTDSLIRAAGQTGPIYFRPPYGDKLVGLPWFLSRTGRTTVMWSIEPDSYADVAASPQRIVAYVLRKARPGAIILLHPWYPSRVTSREAIGPMIDSLQARGYRVVSARALLSARARSPLDSR